MDSIWESGLDVVPKDYILSGGAVYIVGNVEHL